MGRPARRSLAPHAASSPLGLPSCSHHRRRRRHRRRPRLLQHYPGFAEMWCGINSTINQANAIRYFILHAVGGLYLDLDVECWRGSEAWLSGADVVLQVGPRARICRQRWLVPPASPCATHICCALVVAADRQVPAARLCCSSAEQPTAPTATAAASSCTHPPGPCRRRVPARASPTACWRACLGTPSGRQPSRGSTPTGGGAPR